MRASARLIGVAGVLALAGGCGEAAPPVPCEGAVLPELRLHVGESLRVVACFTAEALPLAYSVEVSDPAVVSVEVAGRTVEVSGEAVGQAAVSVVATDVNGRSARQSTRVVVPNRAPAQVADLPVGEIPLWNVVELDLNDYIADADGEPLDFTVRTRGTGALKAGMRGDTLVLHAVALEDRAGLDIGATDPHGDSLSLSVATTVGPAMVYLTQGAHARHGDVPLVAGKPALMRLFVVTDSFGVAVPGVTASILDRDGNLLRTFNPSRGGMTNVPREIDERRSDRYFTEEIAPEHLVRGAGLVVDIERTKDPTMTRRIEKPLSVVQMPVLELTLVPVVMGGNDEAVRTVDEIERDPLNHPLLADTRALLPVDTLVLHKHLPFHVSNERTLIGQLAAMWQLEGRRGVYLGIIPREIADVIRGEAIIGGGGRPPVAYSVRLSSVIAHELGHVFSLWHAPCGADAFVDPDYPYRNGVIGMWGYDFASRKVVPPDTYDVMTYCHPVWISDYNYGAAVRFRLRAQSSRPAPAGKERVLAVQGSVDADGNPVLHPAFYIDGTPTAVTGDSHVVTASGPGGVLFSYRFAPHEIVDGPGGASFFHLVPVTWRDEQLDSITFATPDGRISTLDVDAGAPYPVVIRDGQVVRLPERRQWESGPSP